MKAKTIATLWLGVIIAGQILLSSFDSPKEENYKDQYPKSVSDDKLKKEVFETLETKCNVCHRKQNPFMVFNEKNMTKRAKKIYKMVFLEKKMPKGNEIGLTKEEYINLEKWLFTQNIF
jgi:uncharacterized membrane protein